MSGASTVFTEIDGLASNQGSFTVANGRNFTTQSALANSGTLTAAGGSTLTTAGAVTQSSAGTLRGDGTFVATSFNLSGTLAAGGTVSTTTGAFTDGPGTMTLTGDTTLNPDALLVFQLGMALIGASDHINVTGAFTLDGTLDVAALAGFGAGTYDLIDYAGGQFTDNGLDLGTTPAGFNYQIITTVPGQVDLVVTAVVPEPSTWAMMLMGVTLLLVTQCWRRRHYLHA